MLPQRVIPCLVALIIAAPCFAESVDVAGNPAAGGWFSAGNSLQTGVYVQNSNRYSFDLYWTSFTVSPGSELLGGGFQVGDEVIGIGAVSVLTNRSGGQTYNKALLSDLSQVNSKFGTLTPVGSTPLYSPDPSPFGSPYGNGSHSAGNGGVGSIMLTVGSQLSNTTLTSVRLDRSHRHDGTSSSVLGTSTDTDYIGKYIAKTSPGPDGTTLDSFEFFLSNGELVRQGFTPIPLNAGFIATYHHVSNNALITDAYGQTAAVLPLPLAGSAGLALIGLTLGRRARGAAV